MAAYQKDFCKVNLSCKLCLRYLFSQSWKTLIQLEKAIHITHYHRLTIDCDKSNFSTVSQSFQVISFLKLLWMSLPFKCILNYPSEISSPSISQHHNQAYRKIKKIRTNVTNSKEYTTLQVVIKVMAYQEASCHNQY